MWSWLMTILCFEAHVKDGRVWALRHRGRWTRAKPLVVTAPVVSVYRGRKARQPKAYFACLVAVTVTRRAGALIVRAA